MNKIFCKYFCPLYENDTNACSGDEHTCPQITGCEPPTCDPCTEEFEKPF